MHLKTLNKRPTLETLGVNNNIKIMKILKILFYIIVNGPYLEIIYILVI